MKEWQPFKQMPQPWQIMVTGQPAMLDAVEMAVEDEVLTITRDLDSVEARQRKYTREADNIVARLTLLVDEADRTRLLAMIAQAAAPFAPPEIYEMKLADTDWVSRVQKDFPSFTMGPFYVYGSHANEAKPANKFPLLIDAAAAFGTGEHATTAGCLLALAREKRTRKHTGCVLDMGCGTAILAIAGARLWKNARIVACDNDPVAVKVSRHNLRVNRIGSRSTAFVSDGYKARQLHREQYPLIVANILAKPLMRMARDASRSMAPGGTLILSGLLKSQEPMVLSAHRAQGRYLKHKLRRGNWSVLVLR
jgi:ribosomal protein L11 methyltransferase